MKGVIDTIRYNTIKTALNSRRYFGPSQAGLGGLSGKWRLGPCRGYKAVPFHEVVSYIRNKTDEVHLPQMWAALMHVPISLPVPGLCILGSQLSFRNAEDIHSLRPTLCNQVLTEGALQEVPLLSLQKVTDLLLHPFRRGTFGVYSCDISVWSLGQDESTQKICLKLVTLLLSPDLISFMLALMYFQKNN